MLESNRETMRELLALQQYGYEMMLLLEKRLARVYHGVQFRRGTPSWVGFRQAAYVFIVIKDEDRRLSMDDFSRRFLEPAAAALIAKILSHVDSTREILTAPYIPPVDIRVDLTSPDVPMGLGFGVSANSKEGGQSWVFGIEYWQEREEEGKAA